MSHTLSNETPVIVTGGASGIGRACAEALAEVGRPVAVWDLDAALAGAAADAIADSTGVRTLGLAVDVSDIEKISDAVVQSRTALGRLGGLVHAAGVAGVATLEQLTPDVWAQVLDINLRAEVFIIQAMLPDLKVSSGAAVVGIASINATLGNLMNPAYSASKGGMLAVSRALADDLAQHGGKLAT